MQKALNLTDDQKDSLKVINEDLRKDMQELMPRGGFGRRGGGGGGGGDFQANMKKMTALRKEAMEKALATLKDDQKAKWKEMTGSPFEIQFGGFGGGRGRGNRGQPPADR